ncbi:MAG: hypothetical protein J6M27_15725 [Lachnospiraceae bacterium]|nr:hypothetical protein [Lachnospiraceae bacterium]
MYASGREIKDSPDWISTLPSAQNENVTQLFIVAGGPVQYGGAWFYVVKGRLAEDYTGSVAYDGATFDVVNGMLQRMHR